MREEKQPQAIKAVGILMDLSADERTRLLEESRQKALWDYNSRMKGAQSSSVRLASVNAGFTPDAIYNHRPTEVVSGCTDIFFREVCVVSG